MAMLENLSNLMLVIFHPKTNFLSKKKKYNSIGHT